MLARRRGRETRSRGALRPKESLSRRGVTVAAWRSWGASSKRRCSAVAFPFAQVGQGPVGRDGRRRGGEVALGVQGGRGSWSVALRLLRLPRLVHCELPRHSVGVLIKTTNMKIPCSLLRPSEDARLRLRLEARTLVERDGSRPIRAARHTCGQRLVGPRHERSV